MYTMLPFGDPLQRRPTQRRLALRREKLDVRCNGRHVLCTGDRAHKLYTGKTFRKDVIGRGVFLGHCWFNMVLRPVISFVT